MSEREIERTTLRARSLGVDPLVSRLYFDHGLSHYVLSSRHPDFVVSSIVDATQPSPDQIELTLGTHRYGFQLRSVSHDPEATEELDLRRDGELVFRQKLKTRCWGYDEYTYRTLSVMVFVEGPWVDDLQSLQREFEQLANARVARQHHEQLTQHATRMGLRETSASGASEGWLARLFKGLFNG